MLRLHRPIGIVRCTGVEMDMRVVLKVGDVTEGQVDWAAGRVVSTCRPSGHGRNV